MKIKLNFKNKTILATIAVLVITYIAGHNFIYKSNIANVERLKVQIAEAKNIKLLTEELRSLNSKISSYAVIRNDSPEPSAFLSKVVDIASSCEIKIDSINAGNVINEGPYKFLPCGIIFEAPYKKLRLFLDKLEKDKKYIRVDILQITALKSSKYAGGVSQEKSVVKKDKDGVWVDVNMNLTGFYFE